MHDPDRERDGCGKSTIATNLAAFCARGENKSVVLADFDPQGSSLQWLEARSPNVRTSRACLGSNPASGCHAMSTT
jgi:MinD-like ATPase involved in chromosome partitioning or flagellar assembly